MGNSNRTSRKPVLSKCQDSFQNDVKKSTNGAVTTTSGNGGSSEHYHHFERSHALATQLAANSDSFHRSVHRVKDQIPKLSEGEFSGVVSSSQRNSQITHDYRYKTFISSNHPDPKRVGEQQRVDDENKESLKAANVLQQSKIHAGERNPESYKSPDFSFYHQLESKNKLLKKCSPDPDKSDTFSVVNSNSLCRSYNPERGLPQSSPDIETDGSISRNSFASASDSKRKFPAVYGHKSKTFQENKPTDPKKEDDGQRGGTYGGKDSLKAENVLQQNIGSEGELACENGKRSTGNPNSAFKLCYQLENKNELLQNWKADMCLAVNRNSVSRNRHLDINQTQSSPGVETDASSPKNLSASGYDSKRIYTTVYENRSKTFQSIKPPIPKRGGDGQRKVEKNEGKENLKAKINLGRNIGSEGERNRENHYGVCDAEMFQNGGVGISTQNGGTSHHEYPLNSFQPLETQIAKKLDSLPRSVHRDKNQTSGLVEREGSLSGKSSGAGLKSQENSLMAYEHRHMTVKGKESPESKISSDWHREDDGEEKSLKLENTLQKNVSSERKKNPENDKSPDFKFFHKVENENELLKKGSTLKDTLDRHSAVSSNSVSRSFHQDRTQTQSSPRVEKDASSTKNLSASASDSKTISPTIYDHRSKTFQGNKPTDPEKEDDGKDSSKDSAKAENFLQQNTGSEGEMNPENDKRDSKNISPTVYEHRSNTFQSAKPAIPKRKGDGQREDGKCGGKENSKGKIDRGRNIGFEGKGNHENDHFQCDVDLSQHGAVAMPSGNGGTGERKYHFQNFQTLQTLIAKNLDSFHRSVHGDDDQAQGLSEGGRDESNPHKHSGVGSNSRKNFATAYKSGCKSFQGNKTPYPERVNEQLREDEKDGGKDNPQAGNTVRQSIGSEGKENHENDKGSNQNPAFKYFHQLENQGSPLNGKVLASKSVIPERRGKEKRAVEKERGASRDREGPKQRESLRGRESSRLRKALVCEAGSEERAKHNVCVGSTDRKSSLAACDDKYKTLHDTKPPLPEKRCRKENGKNQERGGQGNMRGAGEKGNQRQGFELEENRFQGAKGTHSGQKVPQEERYEESGECGREKKAPDPSLRVKSQPKSFKTDEERQSREKGNSKAMIEAAFLRMKDRTAHQLEEHSNKILLVKDCLENKNRNRHEVDALTDKLAELENQKKEFEKRIESLKKSLGELKSQRICQEDIDSILLDVGIECNRLAAGLPMYARRSDLIQKVKSNQVSIILGETGSGKSTQLAQYLWEEGLAGTGQIVCTQPRKVAALSLADRVSTELVRNLGGIVGYKAGMRQKHGEDTKIVFCTDHSLLNECLADPDLSKYSCIIIDEAHERSIYTDILLGMIKSFLPRRPKLKLVITSATINPEVFIRYFKTSQELRVSGRVFPVEIIYERAGNSTPFEDYEKKAVEKVIEIHEKQGRGDILVFLTSAVEIGRCCEELTKRLSSRTDFVCLPLHGQLPPEEQRKVFEHLRDGIRKIVFSTNCAETSITIDGIKFVVDTGVVNEMRYDPKKNMSCLGTRTISQSSADQRKGRAGRTSSGTCYRLYPEASYRSMEAINQPEILRVHLGQAVLKLAELGVDVRKYDFVESPGQDAIDSAICALQELEALSLENALITNVGKWLSKLPFDPRQSYVVYLGHKRNLLHDALTLAALVSSGTNMIYRGLNEKEVQVTARTKSLFGSRYGDLFMWFDIYKAWVKLPQNEQAGWCRKNCINHKVLSLAKQTIREVGQILNKELGLRLDVTYLDGDDGSVNTLRRLLFEANLPSVCHFSGLKKAGYFVAKSGQQVHPHPSSTLASQDYHPEWIIYTQLTKTSRDFIKGITLVEESWINDAIDCGKLAKDFFKVKDYKVDTAFHKEVGRSVFRQLVGPKYSNLRSLEQQLSKAGMSNVFVEADRNLGIFDVYATTPMHSLEADRLQQSINEAVSQLRLETKELSVGQKESGVRVVLGEGACVTDILMPNQSNKVCLSQADSEVAASEADVWAKFSKFGKITECKQFRRKKAWGFVKYESNKEARKAFEATLTDPHWRGTLMVDASKLEACVTWCRRPIKGRGMAFVKCDPLVRTSLVGNFIAVNDGRLLIKVSTKDPAELVIFNTGPALEDEIKSAILEEVPSCEEENLQVRLLRETVHEEGSRELEKLIQQITDAFEEFVGKETFSVRLLNPKKGSPNYIAFVCFDDPIEGFQACRDLSDRGFYIGGLKVKIKPKLKTSIFIPEEIMEVCQQKFKLIKKSTRGDDKVSLKFRAMRGGNYFGDVAASDKEAMVRVRAALQEVLEGHVINCCQTQPEKVLLNKQGIEFLQKLETDIEDIAIRPCLKTNKVHIFGFDESVEFAKYHIKEYLDNRSEIFPEEISLRGPEQPVGLMRLLMKQFPNLRKEFVTRFGIEDVTIDYNRHTLSVVGSEESRTKVKESLINMGKMMPVVQTNKAEQVMPDCVTCMCPVENSTELYRLESCGHPVCLTCLRHQLCAQVDAKQFPLTCTAEACQHPLVWRDINLGLNSEWLSEEKLVGCALDAFVTANGKKFKFCQTPNCPVAYEVTNNPEGCEFKCPSCEVCICSSCSIAAHAGLTCIQAATRSKDDQLFQEWRELNSDRCKICPGCSNPVEKSAGCNHMQCTCGQHFCWLCLQTFHDDQECYKHLRKHHGGMH
ncbi:hypothetical protein RRG08_009555 [Elysia crispata]|uniref:RNA helicase n=1 Tax=Elysia crispata TaxID=231223 RepID=A0AAE0ZH69_9GAST|nr:hypothetical protein RRG08_009555 [Elysia crispata]